MDNPINSATLTGMPELTLEELEALDSGLDLFRSGRGAPAELLAVGLHPPLPVSGGRLVWGFALLAAARTAGLARLPCRLLEDLPPVRQLALALQLEDRAGAYRWSEKLGFAGFAQSAGFALNGLAGLIEGRPDQNLERRIAEFAGLTPALSRLVDDGGLDLRAALAARGLPEEAVTAAASSRLSFAERRAFLALLTEITLQTHLPPEQTSALAAEALAAPRPLQILEQQRYPRLTELKRGWSELTGNLLSGSGVTISPPPWFEGDSIEVRFAFTDRQTLTRRLRALARVEHRCDELTGFLR